MLASEEEIKFIQDVICERAEEGFFNGKETVIFGCNAYAKDIRNILASHNIELKAILDNNTEKQKRLCLRVSVYSPEEYLKCRKSVAIVIYSSYWKEMVAQIEELGYDREQTIVLIPFRGHKNPEVDTIDDFMEKFEKIQSGYYVYKNLISKYPEAERLFACPYNGTGDVYMACSFLQQYMQKAGIHDFAMLVKGDNCRRVVKMFGIDNVEVLTNEEMSDLLNAWVFLGTEKISVKPLLHWGWRTKNTPYIFDNEKTSFADMFRYDVFGLDDDDEMSIPAIDRTSTYAERVFREMNLPKGRTVIIAPYANSFVSEIGMELWEQMAAGLKERGYEVCTNCFGNEKPIRGTKQICFPYEEAVNVLEYAGGFIALRSGLCEIVSSAKCKMVIFYENGARATSYEHFSLKKMGLNQDEIPIIFEKDEDIQQVFQIWK